MTKEEIRQVVDIRKRGKTSGTVSQEEHKFCDQMWKKYPKAYSEIDNYIRLWTRWYVWPSGPEPKFNKEE
jgi:hypothetical protein